MNELSASSRLKSGLTRRFPRMNAGFIYVISQSNNHVNQMLTLENPPQPSKDHFIALLTRMSLNCFVLSDGKENLALEQGDQRVELIERNPRKLTLATLLASPPCLWPPERHQTFRLHPRAVPKTGRCFGTDLLPEAFRPE